MSLVIWLSFIGPEIITRSGKKPAANISRRIGKRTGQEGSSIKDWPAQPKHDMEPSQVHSTQKLKKLIDDLNFISTLRHNFTQFIIQVYSFSQTWGGLMWAIGWRKSYNKNQILNGKSRSLGLKTRLHSILIIASPLRLVRLLLTFLFKLFPIKPSRGITTL
ncbi:hypothetical protein VP01_1929g1 [Puccinia sorghi]|uniref:Tet-like 2OG-Fe(II) oxygenase domain-containing protein n=1 Tax=Puccinia sorghi TaxID=27349 RepID=A0A0L6VCK9_9BASI|nr:hypothetical protein VP01_1929g1 [Puccinia sorghi]